MQAVVGNKKYHRQCSSCLATKCIISSCMATKCITTVHTVVGNRVHHNSAVVGNKVHHNSADSCRQQNASQAVVVWQGRRKDGHSSQVKLPVPSAPQLSLKNDHLHLQRQMMVNDHWSFLSSYLYQH